MRQHACVMSHAGGGVGSLQPLTLNPSLEDDRGMRVTASGRKVLDVRSNSAAGESYQLSSCCKHMITPLDTRPCRNYTNFEYSIIISIVAISLKAHNVQL